MRPMFTRSLPALMLTAVAAMLGSVRPAEAQLKLCNDSSETISMALAYREDGQVVSRGWYTAKPGECPTVVGGALQNRYYYVRAEGTQGHGWGGDYAFCVSDVRFTHLGDDCAGDGLERRKFFVIDTGLNASWTHGLTVTGAGSGDSNQAVHDAIAGLRVSFRPSVLNDGSHVMLLNNPAANRADVTLKCFTHSGQSKTMAIQVPAYGMSEVGFMQGWAGNFVAGESCEAYHGDEFVWRTTVPRH
jgi:uncharacterized membrane protein